MLRIHPAAPMLQIHATGFQSETGEISVEADDAIVRPADMEWHFAGETLIAASPCFTIRVEGGQDTPLTIEVRNTSPRPRRIRNVSIRFQPHSFTPPLHARIHRQLIRSQTFDKGHGVKPVYAPAPWAPADAPSSMMTVLSNDQTQNALLIGVLPPIASGYAEIRNIHDALHLDGQFGIEIRFDFRQTLPPGASLHTTPLVIWGDAPGEDLIQRYAERFAQSVTHPRRPNIAGWNSWDYYAGAVRRSDMDENADAARKLFPNRIQYLVIDEGWECMWGVWDANWKFPEGLKDFCDSVKRRGMKPGVWTAPLMVNYYTPLYREHPQWFVSDAAGNPFLTPLSYGMMAQLDPTHPEVQHHLRNTYTRLQACGFQYFKCDFVQCVLGAERFHDPTVGRADIIRQVFKIVRESIGPEPYLLSCGSPYESVVDIVNAVRLSGDIHNFWGNIEQNCRAFAANAWIQRAFANGDPDFLIARTPQTTDDTQLNRRIPEKPFNIGVHWCDGPPMNIDEARVLALAIHLTAGDIILGDRLSLLHPNAIEILKKALPPLPAPARPINMFQPDAERTPAFLAEANDQRILAVFNLDEAPRHITLPLQFLHAPTPARDFWTDAPQQIHPILTLHLPPRSARAWRL